MTNFNFLSNLAEKNEVNRALAAEKTLQNAGGGTSQGCTSRSEGTRHKALIIAKQFSRYCVSRSEGAQVTSARSAVDVPMTSYGAPDEHPISIRSASDGERRKNRVWKYVAMIFAVLVMSIANIGQALAVDFEACVASADRSAGMNSSSARVFRVSGGGYSEEKVNSTAVFSIDFGTSGGYYYYPASGGNAAYFSSSSNSNRIWGTFKQAKNADKKITWTNSDYTITSVTIIGWAVPGKNAKITVSNGTSSVTRQFSGGTVSSQTLTSTPEEWTISELTFTSGADKGIRVNFAAKDNSNNDCGDFYFYIRMSGTVAASCDSYQFHYQHGAYWEAENICFSQVGSTINYLTDELALPYAEWYNVTWDGSGSKTHTYGFAGTDNNVPMPFYHNRNKKFGVNPQEGKLGGGLGRFHVYSNSTDDNKYVSFIPTGYTLNFGTGDTWTNDSTLIFSPKTDNWDETEWYTPITTLTDAAIGRKIFVGLKTELGYVWCSPYSEKVNVSGLRTKTGSGDSWLSGGMSTSYAHKTGKFRIYANSGDNNWYVTFVPHYKLTYNANGCSGAPEAAYVSVEETPCQWTLSTTQPTWADHVFLGWSTNSSATEADANAEVADLGTPYSATGDVTLYAVWQACSGPTINSFTRSGKTDGSYEVGTTLGSLTVDASAGNGGTLSYQWYQYDGGAIGSAVVAAGTSTNATYNIPNNVACVERHYYCVVSEEGCSTTRQSDNSGALTLTEPADPCTEPKEVANEIARFFVPCGTGQIKYEVTNANASTNDNTFTTVKLGSTDAEGWYVNPTSGLRYAKLTSNDSYIQIKLKSGNFQAGDVVTAYFNRNNATKTGLTLKTQGSSYAITPANTAAGVETSGSYTLVADAIESDGSIKLFRANSSSYVNRIIVTRVPASASVTATLLTPAYMPTGASGVQIGVEITGASTGWYYRVKKGGGYETPDETTYTTTTWTMTSTIGSGTNTYTVELYNGSRTKMAESNAVTVTGETGHPMTIYAGANGTVSPNGLIYANGEHLHPEITATPASGYHFVNWTLDNANATLANENAATTTITNASGACTITANFEADDACPTEISGGTVYKLQIKTGLTNGNLASTGTTVLTTENYLSEAITNGSASVTSPSAGNAKIADNKAINLDNSAAYITLDLDCPIQEHDIIKYTITQQNGGLYKATSRSDGNLLLQLPKTSSSSTIGQIEVTSGSKLIGKTTLYLFAKSNGAYNYYFEIIRPLKITLDATTNGGTAVDPIYGATDDKVVLPHAFKSGSRFNGWYTAASGGTKQADYYTITTGTTLFAQFTAGCAVTGTMFSLSFPSSLYPASNTTVPANSSMNLLQYATITGGAAIVENTNSSAKGSMQINGKFVLDDAKVCVHITLDCPLQLNDVISTTIETQNLSYTATSTRSTTNYFTKGTNQTTTITADHVLLNSRDIYIWTHSSSGGKLISINISRPVGTKYSVTYDGNDKTSGSVPTDASEYDPADEVTTAAQGALAKTNYTFGGWNTANDGTGTNTAAGSTFSITDNTTLYAKWTQAVTLDANTANHGNTGGSATAVWNAKALTGITHATPASGYKLLGYYTTASGDGVKVLNSDGTFAGSNVTDYITSGKWSRTDEAPTLYARYESSGALIWNLGVNTNATSLTTSSKESSFTQIAVANMTNAVVTGLTYTGNAKSNLTGKISTPASYGAGKYVSVTFQVADGYKFTPNSVKVKVQPISAAQYVKLELTDNAATPNSISYTTASTQSKGSTSTVEMTNGGGTYFTGTVTLKIFCYGTEYATDGYRLGTPIQIDGEVEETCATMPSFTQMNYSTTTFVPNADASGSPITIIGGENINTYLWKYNTTNDRTSGTDCGTNSPSLVPLTDVASGTTRYYWCEMTNNECHITIKSPAVAITVVAAKSDATVSWTGTEASANYGGGGYTVTATVSPAGWDGTLTEDMLTAMDGVVLSNINVTNDGKTISANFGVTEGANAEATNVAFYLNHPATTGYNAIDETYNTTTLNTLCIGAGGGDGTSYDVRVRKNTTTILQGKSTVYGWDTPTKGFVTQNTGGSVTSTKSGYDDVPVFDSISKGNAKAYWVKSYVANVKKIKVYGQVGDDDLTATGVYHVGSFVAGGSSTAVAYTVVYEDEVDALKKGNHWFEITLDEAISTNDIIYFTVNKNFKIMGVRLTTVGAGGATLATELSAWSPTIDTRKEVNEDAASFVETVTKTGANANTMGAITYSSGDETIATVDNRTGRVTIANSITWDDDTYKDVIITARLAPSGCYQGTTATYTLRVKKLTCTEAAGTITASSEGSNVVIEGDEVKKCTSETITLTLGGYEEGATSFQWYKDGVLQDDKTTSSITTGDAGVWYAVSNKGCAVTSTNEITITNRSTSAHVTRLAKEWYIKNGRLTPDIALWQLGDDCSFVSVAASGSWDTNTGLTAASSFYEEGGIVYLKGTEPNTNTGDQQNYTLTLTVNDGCGNQTLDDEGKIITIHHQQNTDKHVLAFVVRGTEKGGWTDGVTADQTTNVGLYNAIAENFDVIATNSWSTDDEQKLKEYYSQFDILCITDYPDTKKDKGANKKSTVDALGALVDIRPILTMEAWVSGLDNWRAKGISGNPKSPKTRQYTMLLQCKDHEIFAGTELTQVGTGDEAMFRISMVDNTKEDYATLDATYGGGTHAEKEGYQYGKKPALQGFTYTQEMSNNDLLPLGLIDDGSGNDLQVGIERQAVMEARLMVLGINSYAMERLDKDGETVVINALNYLLKKNAEDIADCSISFVGGAEGDAKNWHNVANWTGNTLPTKSQKVRILADCELNEPAHVAGVTIVNGGKYNHGNDDAKGKLTIMPNGALVVTGKVQEAKAPAYNKPYATSPEHLIINTSETAQAALIFDNEEAKTKATVKYYSLGRKIGSAYQFQYFAIPFEYLSVSPTFANVTHSTTIYTFVWHEASGWERRGYYSDLYAFEGVGITTASTSAITYEMKGTLASTAEREITLTKDNDGENIIGNSWMAPIDIASLRTALVDDDNVDEVVYIYCTGNDNGTGSSSSSETAGKWLAIPIDASGWPGWTGQKVIPAMQAYYIKANAETTLTLNYDEVVRSTAVEQLNVPLKAPRRTMNNDGISLLTLRLENSKEHTDLYLFEGERFSDGYDNGWEAKQMADEGVMQFYAMNGEDKMAVLATDELEGTPVCFTPGNESNYTISFFGGDGRYYLNDLKEEQSTAIEQGNTYSFTYEQGDMPHRFLISTTPFGIPSVTTGIGGVEAQEKVQKVIYNDHVYIIRGGKIYDVMGKMMK